MAKCRIGHFAEARVLEALGVDFIDESEVLTPADEAHHVDKHAFKVPFVCGCRDLGEALRRIGEGAALVRTKGEAGTRQHRGGGAPPARGHVRHPAAHRPRPRGADGRGQEPGRALRARAAGGRGRASCPVPNFAAGGIATPADAALMMALGAESVFVGSGIFKSQRPGARARRRSCAPPPTGRTRRWWPRSRAASARRCAASRSPPMPEGERLADARLVMAGPFGVLALQGDFAAHAAAFRDARRAGARGAPRGRARRPRRPHDPRAARAPRSSTSCATSPGSRRSGRFHATGAAWWPAPARARSSSRARCGRASGASASSTR